MKNLVFVNRMVLVSALSATMALGFAGGGGQQQNQQQGQGQGKQQNQGQGQSQGRSQAQSSQGRSQGQSQNDSRHQNTGRSGQSDYKGSNNQEAQRGEHRRYSPPPTLHATKAEQEIRERTKDFKSVYGSGARIGYSSYRRGWEDRNFVYPYYIFDPYQQVGYISPWYFYPCLPGYISPDRCQIVNLRDLPAAFVGIEYTGYRENDAYQQGYNAGYQAAQNDNRVLNNALDDITAVFLKQDTRALDHLVPETGGVNIYVDSQYSYTLAANDFYDLIRDNAQTTHTVDYQILDVRTSGDQAKVLAAHTFEDPYGDRQTVYHAYILKLGNRGAQIVEYGTSASRPW